VEINRSILGPTLTDFPWRLSSLISRLRSWFTVRVCRSSAEHYRERVIKRKAEIVEEERRKEAERRRLERERLERLEKARIGRLLSQAKALREAQEIRAYVAAVRARQSTLDDPLGEAKFEDWADWALSQADRLDPVLSGSFRTVQVDD
jgi:hypothetical protein